MTISDISFQNFSREVNGVAYQSHSGFFLRGQCAAIVIAAAFRTALALPYRIGTGCTAVLLSRLDLAGTRRMRALFHGGRISCGTHVRILSWCVRWAIARRRCFASFAAIG